MIGTQNVTPRPSRLYSAYIDTSTQGPGTIQPPPLAEPGPLDPRRAAAIDQLIKGRISDHARKRLQTILQPIPTGELEALKRFGVRFNIVDLQKEKGPKALFVRSMLSKGAIGGYMGLNRQIYFAEQVFDSDLGPHTTVHELCHAIDDMRGARHSIAARLPLLKTYRGLKRSMESSHDAEMRTLYQKYQARANVEDADVMRREVKLAFNTDKDGHLKTDANGNLPREKDMPLPDHLQIMSDFDAAGQRPVSYDRFKDVDGTLKERFSIAPLAARDTRTIARAALGAALIGAGAALPALLGPAAIPVGAIFLGMAGLSLAKQAVHKLMAPKTEVDVDMVGGARAHVLEQNDVSTITMPADARSFTGTTWGHEIAPGTNYAHRGDMGDEDRGLGEYTAEGWSTYLEGGDKAQNFRDADPEFYRFIEKRAHQEFAEHP